MASAATFTVYGFQGAGQAPMFGTDPHGDSRPTLQMVNMPYCDVFSLAPSEMRQKPPTFLIGPQGEGNLAGVSRRHEMPPLQLRSGKAPPAGAMRWRQKLAPLQRHRLPANYRTELLDMPTLRLVFLHIRLPSHERVGQSEAQ